MVKGRTVGNLFISTTPTVEELKRSVERLQVVIDEAPIGIVNIDLRGKITYVNKRFEEVSGYSREEMLGKNGLKLGMFSSETVKLLGKRMKDRLMGRPPLLLEMQFKCKDGHWIWVTLEGKLRREQGIPVGFQIISTDITERKRVEEALQQSNVRFRDIAENALEWIWEVDANGKYTYVSPIVEKILGYKPEEVLKKHFYDLFHPDDHEKLKEAAFEVFAKKQAFRQFLNRNVHKNGKTVWLSTSGVPILDEEGNLLGYRGADVDITERKRAEEALLESEERFRSIVENAHDGIMILDDAYRFIYVNDELCRMSGYPREEIIGQDFRKFLDEESKQLVADRYIRRQKGEEVPPRYEFNIVRKDGQKRRVEISSSVIKDSAGRVKTVAQILDVTERRQVEKALHQSEQRYRNLFELAPYAIVTLDKKGVITSCNAATLSFTGYSKDEIVGKHFSKLSFLRVSDIPTYVKLFISLIKGSVPEPFEVNYHTKDGTTRWTQAHVGLLGGDVGKEGFQVAFGDITERKQAEEAALRERDKVQQYLNIAEVILIATDEEDRVNLINRKGCQIMGYKEEEIIGKKWPGDFVPEEAKAFERDLLKQLISGEADHIEYESPILTKDGEERMIRWHDTVTRGEKGAIIGTLSSGEDITERKRMEREIQEKNGQLIRSERLAAIGQLAGGVGHELRNPLGAIKNAVYYIKGKVASSELGQREPRVMEFLDIIDGEINSSSKIITDLLGFSRVGKPSVSPARIEKIIEDALSHAPIPENIELTKKLDAGLPEINVDPDQIKEVVVNIITNAVEAMPEGGRLLIATREKDKFLEVEVSDTGCGIPQESMDKIFDPLFTTKAKGIGLGLPVCKAIIDRHEGGIAVESKVGEGTTFNIKLPLGRNVGGN